MKEMKNTSKEDMEGEQQHHESPLSQRVRDPASGAMVWVSPPPYVYDLEAAASTWVHSTRGLLLKEAKRRRLEILLQSTAAITLPMFLVTNFFTMNVPGIPSINFWWVFLLTMLVGCAVLALLIFVWFGFFFNKRKASRKVRRLVRRRRQSQQPDARDASVSTSGSHEDEGKQDSERFTDSSSEHQDDDQGGDEEMQRPPRPSLEMLIPSRTTNV